MEGPHAWKALEETAKSSCLMLLCADPCLAELTIYIIGASPNRLSISAVNGTLC